MLFLPILDRALFGTRTEKSRVFRDLHSFVSMHVAPRWLLSPPKPEVCDASACVDFVKADRLFRVAPTAVLVVGQLPSQTIAVDDEHLLPRQGPVRQRPSRHFPPWPMTRISASNPSPSSPP